MILNEALLIDYLIFQFAKLSLALDIWVTIQIAH